MTREELFKEVRARARGETWRDRRGYELLFIGLRLGLYGLGAALFFIDDLLVKALAVLVMSYAYFGIVITGTHEARHNSLVDSARGNRLLGYLFADALTGQSADWWHQRHVKEHHLWTNIREHDPPLYIFPWMNRYVYFFVVPWVIQLWLLVNSFQFERARGGLLRWSSLFVAGYVLQAWPLALELGWPAGLGMCYVVRHTLSPLFMHLAVFNHIGLEFPEERGEWVAHQLRTTRNLRWNWFLAGFGGNAFLNTHIEHHVFPQLSNHELSAARTVLIEYAEANGIEYREEGYLEVLRQCLDGYEALMEQARELSEPEISSSQTLA